VIESVLVLCVVAALWCVQSVKNHRWRIASLEAVRAIHQEHFALTERFEKQLHERISLLEQQVYELQRPDGPKCPATLRVLGKSP